MHTIAVNNIKRHADITTRSVIRPVTVPEASSIFANFLSATGWTAAAVNFNITVKLLSQAGLQPILSI